MTTDAPTESPAAVGDEIERDVRVALDDSYPCIGPACKPTWQCAPCNTRDRVIRLVRRKVLEGRKVLLLRIPYMAATQQHVDHLEDWEQTELAAIAAELADLETEALIKRTVTDSKEILDALAEDDSLEASK
jgi:hypothetical protein